MSHNISNFSGIYAESYDQLYLSLDPVSELKQAEIFCEVSQKDSPTVIDVGGGTGRFASLLCQRYRHVYLVEPSTAMTAIAEAKLTNCQNLTIINGNAQNFEIDIKAEGAYLMFSVASYFSSPTIFRTAIENIISNLVPRSFIYFDIWESSKSTFDGFRSTVKRFTQNGTEYERIVTINPDSIVEKEEGFHTLDLTISFQKLQTVDVYRENHELALITKKWILDFCALNTKIDQVRTRKNPMKANNLEVCILLK